MAEVVQFLQLVLRVVLKLILTFLKKNPLESAKMTESSERYDCLQNIGLRKRLFLYTPPHSSTMSQESVSSGIGSSIISDENMDDISTKGDLLFEPDNKATQFRAELERLGHQNITLRDRLYMSEYQSRREYQVTELSNVASRTKSMSCVSLCRKSMKSHPASDATRTSTPRATKSDFSVHGIVLEKLMKNLQCEREENRRLQDYINDLMYAVLETTPQILEK